MEEKYEPLIQGILDHGYGTAPLFFDESLIKGLRENLLRKRSEGMMHPAAIGKRFTFQKNLKVRGDLISWIDEHNPDPLEQQFLGAIDAFVQYLNRTCYTGINGYEFHYAFYEEGSFYRRHLDQFQQDRGRKFSVVTYLNDDWKPEAGGELVLYLDGGEQSICPEGGRVVFFKSDEIEHEVKAARRDRLSIAGWLKAV
ncbi:MAG: 2OG-Fe(II) oxygenase [Lewinellaceae bacterium]|nr:2OG-Fe(II) oxygenase [Saprospiraceae bacterium]MCB9337785.1 2OG-Fe(II) oxygenase [Lewinellaceae bacterium]